MNDVYAYLKWRGDLSFERDPLNEADHLVFSMLSYVNMDDLDSEGKTLQEIFAEYSEKKIDQSRDTLDPSGVLEQCAKTCRYQNVTVSGYTNSIDDCVRRQFCAMIFHYLPDEAYVAFRGTDSTFTGWREDFNMSAVSVWPGQLAALAYVDRNLKGDISYVFGGHSKGGNLAQFAAMYCREEVRKRIRRIVSLDGPGFRPEIAGTDEFLATAAKTIHFLPEQSVIGLLLENPVSEIVVDCSKSLLDQHDPYTWQIEGCRFIRAEKLSAISVFIKETVDLWLCGLSDEERLDFINLIFDSISASGAKRINEFADHPFTNSASILTALSKADKATQSQAYAVIGKLAQASTGTIWNRIRQAVSEIFEKEDREDDHAE
ncbi:MAG: DUF2974 domain-containing protein [Solobacterium sp.]|nr:DUF2974 domain-containing protein [Solobacterium sp.]